MANKKKKILIHSNHCRARTGFGKHMKHLITYLYKTGKYEIVEFANGIQWNDPKLSRLPWKGIGSLPHEPETIQQINADPNKQRSAAYGHFKIDDVIKQEKPDIYLGIEDIWGLEGFWSKKWWKKINSLIWTPVDSLPLLDKHLDSVANTSNYIVQASFAKNELNSQGFNNVHLFPVPLDPENFYRLKEEERVNLRKAQGIPTNDFIIGFVFRNQLRKSVPNMLEGFKLFKEKNPHIQARLLFHTHWSEGWDIPRLLKEKSIDPSLVLTTYYCDKCRNYQIKAFVGQNQDCPFCGTKGSQQTAQITRGVNEEQLNQIYNLMDVYCHPFTSGGQEIPIQEAKLNNLITLVTNYSCGEDYCSEESGGLPLNWTEYREPGTQFIKASTDSEHIAEQLEKVYNMSEEERLEMGKKAREFTIDFCSINSVCSQFETLIDNMKPTEWDFDFSFVEKDPNYMPPDIKDDREWVIDLYKNILKSDNVEKEDSQGIDHWVHRLNSDLNRQQVVDYFKKVAVKENAENNKIPFEDILDKDDDGKRILFVLPENENDIFLSTSLLDSIKNNHPDCNIYYATKPEFYDLLQGNNNIHKIIQYDPIMENISWSSGQGSHKGYFKFVVSPNTNTHKFKNYAHSDSNPVIFDLCTN